MTHADLAKLDSRVKLLHEIARPTMEEAALILGISYGALQRSLNRIALAGKPLRQTGKWRGGKPITLPFQH